MDLEMAFDRVPKRALVWTMMKKEYHKLGLGQ